MQEATIMKNENGRVLALLLAMVTAVAAVEAVVLFRMDNRLSTLEEQNPMGTVDENGPAPLALGEEVRELREKLDIMTRTQMVLRKQTTSVDGRLSLIEREAAGALAEGLRTADGSAGVSAEAMEAAVARAVEEKIKEMPRGGGNEWKPSMQEMREALDMTEDQTTASESIIDDAKHELYEIAQLRRLDGGSMMEDMVDAFSSEDREAGMKQVFMKLFTEKIPGREETYIAKIFRIKAKAEKGLSGVLSKEQTTKMLRMNIDYLGVKTAYEPFAEYIQEALK